MKTESLIPLLITAILVAVGYIAWYISRKRRSHTLREKFNPEYNYTLNIAEDQRTDEEISEGQENRVTDLDILDLNENQTDPLFEEPLGAVRSRGSTCS